MAVNYTEDERIIGAFLTCYRVCDIMREAGISKSTTYKLKNNPDFMAVVQKRKTEIMRAAVNRMQSYLVKDVEILQGIIENDDNAPQVRLNGIQIMLSQLRDLTTVVDIAERVDSLQKAFEGNFSPAEGVIDIS